jgi:copper transport protein
VSADGHPISGAITFGVGDAPTRVDASTLPGAGDRLSEVLGWASRWLTYVGAFLAAGVAFFVWFLFDGGTEKRKLSRIAFVASAVAILGIFGQLVVHASLATGRGLGAIGDGSVWGPVLGNNLGWAVGVAVLGLVGVIAATVVREELAGQMLSFYGLLAVTVSFALWGHTAEGSLTGLKIAVDAIHTFAGAVWFGGLVGLAVVLGVRRRSTIDVAAPTDTSTDAGSGDGTTDSRDNAGTDDSGPVAGSPASTALVVSRFSTVAAFTVLAIAISGLVLVWQELGSVSALWSTGYGQALLIKLGLVAVIVALAAYNRFRLIPEVVSPRETVRSSASMRKLLTTVRIEAIGLVAVLAVTGVLVNTVPGRTQTVTGPFNQSVAFGANQANAGVTPAQAGPNQIHITFLTPAGQPVAAAQTVQVELTQPQAGVGPITREMIAAGTGHFVVDTNDLSIPGTWQIVFIARVSDFDQQRLTFQVPVG